MKRRENLSELEVKHLRTILEYLPALRTLRDFADKLHRLFDPEQSEHQAWCRWRALQASAAFQAIPELAKALVSLGEEKFVGMIALLRGPVRRRRQVRTNNHAERCNRKLRYWEKVRDKWRGRKTLVRYMVLSLDRWWKEAFTPKAQGSAEDKPKGGKPRVKAA